MTSTEDGTFHGLRGLGPGALLLTGLALSIGWGIRGNFGHEYGAMVPGALAGITVALMAGREDWRRRVAFFALFGALAWGFGGSMSYGHVIAYTQSGHFPSQVYGFFCLYVIGFLWAGMGGAGTALPAVLDQDRLLRILGPLFFVLIAWAGFALLIEPRLDAWAAVGDGTWSRHENPLYWFDSDWLQALVALAAICVYDLVNRMRVRIPLSLAIAMLAILAAGCYLLAILTSYSLAITVLVLCGLLVGLFITHPALVLYAYAGFYAGHFLQRIFIALGGGAFLRRWLVHYQGLGEVARRMAADQHVPVEDLLVANWPDIVLRYPTHLGWILGMAVGIAIYFHRHGRFANGASLFLHMALGWFAGFLLFPVLLSFGGAGFRMTPPRGDNWAGVLGVFLGALLWLHRNQLAPVIWTSLVCGTFGGLGFAGAVLLKLIMIWPGNPARGVAPGTWAHWQSANWHSVMEQSYGFINGIGLAVTMGILAASKGRLMDNPRRGRGLTALAAAFTLLAVPYLNLVKNVSRWIQEGAVAESLCAPLFKSVTFSTLTWFNLAFFTLAIAVLLVMGRHLVRPVALVPEKPLGRGQMLFLVLLWVMVVGNFERQLPHFAENRLITEWVIAMHAVLATVLVLLLPHEGREVPVMGRANYRGPIMHALRWAVIMLIFAGVGSASLVAGLYGGRPAGQGAVIKRFGPEAAWRNEPLLRGQRHR